MPYLHTYTQEVSKIKAQLLTPEAFMPYGGVISSVHQLDTLVTSSANYGTAIAVRKISPVESRYENAPSGTKATTNWNLFRSSPPNHLLQRESAGEGKEPSKITYTAKILERHPFTTQTFLPMGRDKNAISYLVLVAKNLPDSPENLPDPSTIQAFVCKGTQAVTYGVATWHAPMISLIEPIDFAVLVNENGVPEEDCQEVNFEPGFIVEYTSED